MNTMKGRVAVITGAGRGIGREHALLFASEGAKVVVNDLGGNPDGTGADASPATQVVDEIVAAGGEAVANHDDVTDWDGAKRMIDAAVEAFGDLHVLVNNAGILRDRMLVNMTEDEWDAVIKVHLKGHFAPLRHAAGLLARARPRPATRPSGRWSTRRRPRACSATSARPTTAPPRWASPRSRSSPPQELSRYGVRVNAIAPAALTRLTAGAGDRGQPADPPRARRRPTRPWTPATSRPSSPTWPPSTARSTGGCSSCSAGRCSCSSRGPSSTRSRPRAAGPSRTSRSRPPSSPTSPSSSATLSGG